MGAREPLSRRLDVGRQCLEPIAAPGDGKYEWDGPTEEMLSIQPGTPGGEQGPEMQPSNQEMQFENPPQPDFRGDFKPELVQLLARLKNKVDGDQDGSMAPLTKEQLKEMLENSVELSIAEWAEGDIDQSLGMFLENMESAAQGAAARLPTARPEPKPDAEPVEPEPERQLHDGIGGLGKHDFPTRGKDLVDAIPSVGDDRGADRAGAGESCSPQECASVGHGSVSLLLLNGTVTVAGTAAAARARSAETS